MLDKNVIKLSNNKKIYLYNLIITLKSDNNVSQIQIPVASQTLLSVACRVVRYLPYIRICKTHLI